MTEQKRKTDRQVNLTVWKLPINKTHNALELLKDVRILEYHAVSNNTTAYVYFFYSHNG